MNEFNYVTYLKNLKMIGQLDPWKDGEGEPLWALLVPVDNALEECKGWSKQEITRKEFITYLKDNSIMIFNSVDQFVDWKENKKKIDKPERKKFTRNISEERRNQLKEHAKSIREKIRPTN